MEIQKSNNVQFGAKFISPAKVKAKVGENWKNLNVSFVKFEPQLEADRKAIGQVRDLWGQKNLSAGIAEEADILGQHAQIYGLTTQSDLSRSIEPDKILGLLSADKVKRGSNAVQIYKIGTTPAYAYAQKKRTRDIKHVASALIDSFKAMAKKLGVRNVEVSYADPEDMKFLSKVGLEPKNKNFVEII